MSDEEDLPNFAWTMLSREHKGKPPRPNPSTEVISMRNPEVLVQIQTIEFLLASSGVQSFCMACIKSPEGGCCQGCANLGPNGCVEKPLACALWLCSNARDRFPDVSKELRTIDIKWPTSVARGYRLSSLVAESKLQSSDFVEHEAFLQRLRHLFD